MKKGKHEAGNQRVNKPAPVPQHEPGQYAPQPVKPRKRRRGCLVVLLTILILLVMIIVAGFIYWETYVKPPISRNDKNTNGSTVIGGHDAQDPQKTDTDPVGNEDPVDPDMEENVRNQSQSIEIGGSERKEDCFTMLVVGLDESKRLTDTIIVATFNVQDKTVAVLNVPRDTLSSYNGGKIHKINSAYGSGGIERTITEVQNLIGFEIDRHVIVTYDAFKGLIDEIGGIDLYVPQDMYKNTGDMIIDLKEGQQTLDGEHALMFMRFRGYANADLARIEAQQSFYQAVIEKVARPATLLKLPGLASVVMDNVETDLSVGEMIWIGVNYVSMDTDSMVYNTLPNTPRYINDISYVIPNEKQIIKLVNTYYNPYLDAITSLKLTNVPAGAENSGKDNNTASTQDPDPDPGTDADVLPDDPNDGDIEYPDEGDDDGDLIWIRPGGDGSDSDPDYGEDDDFVIE